MAEYKLVVRLADAEFNAEGPEAVVREQFTLFLEALKGLGISNGKSAAAHRGDTATPNPAGNPERAVEPPDPDDALLRRAFRTQGDGLSLMALPRTEARDRDALLLLLYGFLVLKEMSAVPAGPLIEAARVSGIQAARVDRLIDPALVMKAGVKRGSQYSLNNRGITKAKELLATLFD